VTWQEVGDPYGARCDVPVTRAVMAQHWDDLTFLHFPFEPEAVQRLLPPGLTVETRQGRAWVSLVPFFLRVALSRGPSVPWGSRFAETNVRTYVRSADGASGIWFFSLDAARLGAVLVARATYRIPYFWSRMRIDTSAPGRVRYETRRRWPGPRGARSVVEVEIGERMAASDLRELDHFLTARWALFSAPITGLRHARAAHEPWPLHRARVTRLDDELVTAAGLPAPTTEPIVHWSPSVEVRIGMPTRITT
jgi:uncharacterized protein YqjF (DUF2071 family)